MTSADKNLGSRLALITFCILTENTFIFVSNKFNKMYFCAHDFLSGTSPDPPPNPSGKESEADIKNGRPLLGKPLNYTCACMLAISFDTAAN